MIHDEMFNFTFSYFHCRIPVGRGFSIGVSISRANYGPGDDTLRPLPFYESFMLVLAKLIFISIIIYFIDLFYY